MTDAERLEAFRTQKRLAAFRKLKSAPVEEEVIEEEVIPERPESSFLDKTLAYTGGLAGQANQGLVPFSDEIISGIRSVVDPSLYGDDSTIGERYSESHRQLNQGMEQFREDNPKTAIATEMTAGAFSPVNKIGPVTTAYNTGAKGLQKAVDAGARLVNNVARNATEGAVYGLGEGTGDNRWENAKTQAMFASALTAGFDVTGRFTGTLLDWWKLPVDIRNKVPQPDVPNVGKQADIVMPSDGRVPVGQTADGAEVGPIMMSNPETIRGSAYKAGLGKLPGASQRLDAQNAPYVLRDRAAYQGVVDEVADEGSRLADHQRSAGIDVKNQGRAEARAAQEAQRESLSQARAAERDALELENTANLTLAREADEAAADAATLAQRRLQAENQADEALNIETLQLSVPEGRADAVTESGNAGFKQALDQVNEAYDEAWGSAIDLKEGTIDKVIIRAKKALPMLGEVDAKRVERIITDVEKLGESGGSVKVLDELLRNSINATEDQLVRTDLEAIRETLRNGLPEENLAKLDAVDKVYPNLLTTQKAAAQAFLDNGVPTPKLLASSSNVVAGERRAAKGEQPMMPLILENLRNRPQDADAVPPLQAPAAELQAQARLDKAAAREAKDAANQSAANARLTVAENQADRTKDLNWRNTYEQNLFDQRSKAKIGPSKEQLRQTESNARADNPSLYMAALLSNIIPGAKKVPLALKASGVSGLGELMTTMPVQEVIAGQGKRTRQLADAIRSGRSEYVTRRAARAAGQLSPEEKEDYLIYR